MHEHLDLELVRLVAEVGLTMRTLVAFVLGASLTAAAFVAKPHPPVADPDPRLDVLLDRVERLAALVLAEPKPVGTACPAPITAQARDVAREPPTPTAPEPAPASYDDTLRALATLPPMAARAELLDRIRARSPEWAPGAMRAIAKAGNEGVLDARTTHALLHGFDPQDDR